jgi:cation:H+ antiporter
VLWMRQGKDILAVGNITGAMAFQATIPVALGLTLTDWDLDRYALAAGVAGVAGAALALHALPRHRLGPLHAAVWGALFAGFIAFAALG